MSTHGEETLEDYHEETLGSLAVLLEYRRLKHCVPRGVYVLPDATDLRRWHGTIFPDVGLYAEGVFLFQLVIPPGYPADGEPPYIVFDSRTVPFHPLVSPSTRCACLEWMYPNWNAGEHRLAHAVQFAKNLLLLSRDEMSSAAGSASAWNVEAAEMWMHERDAFRERARTDAREAALQVTEQERAWGSLRNSVQKRVLKDVDAPPKTPPRRSARPADVDDVQTDVADQAARHEDGGFVFARAAPAHERLREFLVEKPRRAEEIMEALLHLDTAEPGSGADAAGAGGGTESGQSKNERE